MQSDRGVDGANEMRRMPSVAQSDLQQQSELDGFSLLSFKIHLHRLGSVKFWFLSPANAPFTPWPSVSLRLNLPLPYLSSSLALFWLSLSVSPFPSPLFSCTVEILPLSWFTLMAFFICTACVLLPLPPPPTPPYSHTFLIFVTRSLPLPPLPLHTMWLLTFHVVNYWGETRHSSAAQQISDFFFFSASSPFTLSPLCIDGFAPWFLTSGHRSDHRFLRVTQDSTFFLPS